MRRGRKGFTLIELLVTMSVIGVLIAIGLISYKSILSRARDSKRLKDLKQIEVALDLYRNDHGDYPNMFVNSVSDWNTFFNTYLKDYLAKGDYSDPLSNAGYWWPHHYRQHSMVANYEECDQDGSVAYELCVHLESRNGGHECVCKRD